MFKKLFLLAFLSVASVACATDQSFIDSAFAVPADSFDVSKTDIYGVYAGFTMRKKAEINNATLEAGYVFKPAEKFYVSLGLGYDPDKEVSSTQTFGFFKVRDRLFGLAGGGLSFYKVHFNNTGSLNAGFAYVPNFTFLGSIELAVIARVQYTGYVTIGNSNVGKVPLVDNRTSGEEVWISIIFLGL